MARNALYAPAHVVQGKPSLGNSSNNPDAAPSFFYAGTGLQDPRLIYNMANSATGAMVIGWAGSNRCKVASYAPSTIATANIAAAANVTSGTAMTLVSSTGAGITVVGAGGFVPWPNYGTTIAAGACAIDGLPTYTRFGSGSFTTFYNPATVVGRAVSISGVSGGAGGNFLISGYDAYGYPMSQLLTVGAGANTVTTTKTFKFVTSVVPAFTDAHNYSVGTGDVFGFGLAVDYFADVQIFWNDVLQLVATFTAAVTTSPATTATGDVRGTFTAGSASDGTKRLDIFVTPSLARLANATPAVGLFGVAQV